jgi:hypothetical protein
VRGRERAILYSLLMVLIASQVWFGVLGNASVAPPQDLTLRNLSVESVTLVDSSGKTLCEWRVDRAHGSVRLGSPDMVVVAQRYQVDVNGTAVCDLGLDLKTRKARLAFLPQSSTGGPLATLEADRLAMSSGDRRGLIEMYVGDPSTSDPKLHTGLYVTGTIAACWKPALWRMGTKAGKHAAAVLQPGRVVIQNLTHGRALGGEPGDRPIDDEK